MRTISTILEMRLNKQIVHNVPKLFFNGHYKQLQHPGDHSKLRMEMEIMKIKCIKLDKYPICGEKGSLQVFLNKQNKIKYGRVRHYILKDEEGYNP